MDGLVMDARELLSTLVSIPSVTGEEGRLAAYLAELFEGAGAQVELREVEPGRSNLLVKIPGEGEPLLFMGHLDTVPPGSGWNTDPFTPCWKGSKVVGLGSCDMKGGVAAIVLALLTILNEKGRRRREAWAVFTVGEEVNSLGAYKAVEDWLLGKSFRLLVVPEPTSLAMGIAEKGVLWLRFALRGEGGHASMAQGRRALEDGCRLALDVVTMVRSSSHHHPLLGEATAEITQFHGGWKTNVIPSEASLDLDIRLVPGFDPSFLLEKVSTLLKERDLDCKVEVLNNRPPVESVYSEALDAFASAAKEVLGKEVEQVGLPYYSDVSAVVPRIDVPFVLFGPGDPCMAHTPGEWVDVEEVIRVAKVFERSILML